MGICVPFAATTRYSTSLHKQAEGSGGGRHFLCVFAGQGKERSQSRLIIMLYMTYIAPRFWRSLRTPIHNPQIKGCSPNTVVSTCMAFSASPLGFSEKSCMQRQSQLSPRSSQVGTLLQCLSWSIDVMLL